MQMENIHGKKKAIHIWSDMGVSNTVFSFWYLNLINAIINKKKYGTSCQKGRHPLCLTTPQSQCSPWPSFPPTHTLVLMVKPTVIQIIIISPSTRTITKHNN